MAIMNDSFDHQVIANADIQAYSNLPAAASELSTDPDRALIEMVGVNLKKLRRERGLSLDGLARLSNVSRAMLSQVENGRSSPTVTVLCKIASALNVSLSEFIAKQTSDKVILLQKNSTRTYYSADGDVVSRALFPPYESNSLEFYEVALAPNAKEQLDALPGGATKYLVVSSGTVELAVEDKKYLLADQDAIVFPADQPHQIVNSGSVRAVLYQIVNLKKAIKNHELI